jgi:hypothetical protein
MKRLGAAMPLERGGPPRVEIRDPGGMNDLHVMVDGSRVHTFATPADFKAGWSGALGDGSTLEVALRRRYGALFARFDVRRNGRAIPGSGWDPVRMTRRASTLLIVLGMMPVLDLATGRGTSRLALGLSAVLVLLGGLARTQRKALILPALVSGALALAVRAVLAVPGGQTVWLAFNVLFVLWIIRDARAARDLED